MKSSGPTSGRRPWDKQFAELSKYDWFNAVMLHPKHRDCPRDLKVASVISQFADHGTSIAWPGQQTIAKMAGLADTRQVREAVTKLVGSGAVQTKRVDALPRKVRGQLGEKMSGLKPRAKVYILNLFWAYETFEAYRYAQANGTHAEPAQLKDGKRRKRTDSVRKNRTDSVRLILIGIR